MSMTTRRHTRKGFSLLELSVSLVVVALVAGFGITGGKNALEGSDRVTTQQRMATIKKALDNYAKLNGYLPCPARRDLIPSSASFGVESRTGNSATCTVAGDIKNVPAAPATPTVYIGAVPTRTLGLPDTYAADSWSNKFLYAVSDDHVGNPFSYKMVDGPITLWYGNRTGTKYEITTERDGTGGPSATYVVVSHGPNGRGGYPLRGTAAAVACPSETVTPTYKDINDVENCDDKNADFYDTAYNVGSNLKTYFDDYIVWSSNALERTPLVVQDGSSSGTCLTGTGNMGLACETAINNDDEAPDCNTQCSNAGYSSSGASVTNCTYNAAACATGEKLQCSFQCCCAGTPPAGCTATTDTWGASNECRGDVPIIPHNQSATVYNSALGYTGSETATCTNGVLSYTPINCTAQSFTSSTTSTSTSTSTSSTTSSSTGGRAGCSTGNCEEWCAPCGRTGGGRAFRGGLCEKVLISESPCRAACIYAGCGWYGFRGYSCHGCP